MDVEERARQRYAEKIDELTRDVRMKDESVSAQDREISLLKKKNSDLGSENVNFAEKIEELEKDLSFEKSRC